MTVHGIYGRMPVPPHGCGAVLLGAYPRQIKTFRIPRNTFPPCTNNLVMCYTNHQVALATLSEEQHEVEVRAAKFAKAAEETRTELEEKLRQAIEAAGSAEERAEILRARLEKCRNADKMIAAAETKSSQEKNGRDSAGREITAVLGTTEHTAVDMLSERTTNQTNCRVHVGYEGGAGCNAESTGR